MCNIWSAYQKCHTMSTNDPKRKKLWNRCWFIRPKRGHVGSGSLFPNPPTWQPWIMMQRSRWILSCFKNELLLCDRLTQKVSAYFVFTLCVIHFHYLQSCQFSIFSISSALPDFLLSLSSKLSRCLFISVSFIGGMKEQLQAATG